MTDRSPVIRACEVRMTFHYADGRRESITVVGEERRDCPVSPEKLERYRRFKADREAARQAAQQAAATKAAAQG